MLGIISSEELIKIFTPGLQKNPDSFLLASSLQKILFPSIVFMALGGLIASLYYAHNNYFIPALGPFINNFVALIITVLFVNRIGIFSITFGILIGSAAQVLFLIIFVRKINYHISKIDIFHPGVKKTILLMIPWLLGAAIYKANPLVDRFIASQFEEGSISIWVMHTA